MSEIRQFKSKAQIKKEWIDDVYTKLIEKAESIMVIADTGDTFVTGYYETDIHKKIEFKNHLEFDILDQYLAENINKYIKYVEQ